MGSMRSQGVQVTDAGGSERQVEATVSDRCTKEGQCTGSSAARSEADPRDPPACLPDRVHRRPDPRRRGGGRGGGWGGEGAGAGAGRGEGAEEALARGAARGVRGGARGAGTARDERSSGWGLGRRWGPLGEGLTPRVKGRSGPTWAWAERSWCVRRSAASLRSPAASGRRYLEAEIRRIADMLGVPFCGYAGMFCRNAARVIGGRAWQIGSSRVKDETATIVTVRPDSGGNNGDHRHPGRPDTCPPVHAPAGVRRPRSSSLANDVRSIYQSRRRTGT